MSRASLYDSLQIAQDFIEQANQFAEDEEYEAAYTALEKARSYAFNNEALANEIEQQSEAINKAHNQYIKALETEAAALFNEAPFDGQKARQILQVLLNQNGRSELAKSLWLNCPLRKQQSMSVN